MDEKDWHMLKALYEEGSITKASEVLYVSQPSLTKRIKHLENEFNVQILIRNSKGIRFTPEGKNLVNYAIEMISTLQRTKDLIQSMAKNSISGTLRIGVCLNFAHSHLPYLLKEFTQKFPLVKTQIQTGYTSEVFRLFQDDSIQIAFVRGNLEWNGPKIHLKSENICIVSNESIEISELPNLPRIDYKTDPVLKKQLNQWWNESYNKPPLVAVEVDNSRTCVSLVEQGLGFAILPQFSLGSHTNLYLKNIYDLNGRPLVRDTWIIFKEEEAELSAVKEFIDFVRSTVGLTTSPTA